jgi:hypothetical protein
LDTPGKTHVSIEFAFEESETTEGDKVEDSIFLQNLIETGVFVLPEYRTGCQVIFRRRQQQKQPSVSFVLDFQIRPVSLTDGFLIRIGSYCFQFLAGKTSVPSANFLEFEMEEGDSFVSHMFPRLMVCSAHIDGIVVDFGIEAEARTHFVPLYRVLNTGFGEGRDKNEETSSGEKS